MLWDDQLDSFWKRNKQNTLVNDDGNQQVGAIGAQVSYKIMISNFFFNVDSM